MWCSNCSHHLDWAPPEAAAAPVAEAEPAAPVAESEPTAPIAEPVAIAASLDPQVIPVTPAAVAEAEPIVPIAEGEVAAAPSTDPDVIPVADAPAPRSRRRRPAPVWIFPVVAAALLAVVVALPVAGWFKAASHQTSTPQLPLTAGLSRTPPVATPTPSPVAPTPSPSATPAQPVPQPPIVQQQAVPVPAFQRAAGDPTGSVAGFYQAVAAHQFDAAAALWSAQMQANYPPGEFINHRFAYTQQMDLRQARTLGNNGQVATVYIDLIEVYAGSTRHWVGTWQLVRSSSGWLLNQPDLRAAG